MPALPPYVTRELVAERLPLIFPEGTPNRNYCVRDAAATTVFTALYIGAVEGAGRYLGPVHVYRMTVEQSTLSETLARETYAKNFKASGERWYADNSREQIRDETLRDGLVAIGAVTRREDLATTAGKPKYALRKAFAALFDPVLDGADLEKAIAAFQSKHLSKSALARIKIMQAGAAGKASGVLVTFPGGETRSLAPGPSSIISRAVIEVFAKRFLESPAVLWLSESGDKVVLRDDKLAASIGIKIEPDKNLLDMILVDLGPEDPLIVFVEVVATDGAITPERQEAAYAITDAAGFKRSQVAFLTAYQDRQSAGFKKTVPQLAWRSFAWFVSEPDHIIALRDGSASPAYLSGLIAAVSGG